MSDLLDPQSSPSDQQVTSADSRFSTGMFKQETQHALQSKMGELQQAGVEYEIEAKAQSLGVGYINLQKATIAPNVLGLIPEADASRLQLICFGHKWHESLEVGAVKPEDPEVGSYIAEMQERLQIGTVKKYLISSESYDAVFKQYEMVPKIVEVKTGVEVTPQAISKFSERAGLKDISAMLKEISLTDTVTYLMAAAIKNNATDIHVEAEEHTIKVRFRIDGVLHTVATLDKEMWRQVASRIKLLAKLKINIEDRPQDGRVRLELGENKIDVRVSTLPTAFGESVAMRLLRAELQALSFESLGLVGQAYERLLVEVKRPNGMILTSGPTGAGKTTSLYSILTMLNTPEAKIITIEDPIEYELEGINQSQVAPKKGYDFSDGLKSIVRQDPDVIMVGEMRDAKTVDIAINAALTGHLVLSTIHTRNAAGTVPRLLAMGAQAYLLAPALNAVVAQRLVRKLCETCRTEGPVPEEYKERVTQAFSATPEEARAGVDVSTLKVFSAPGCDACGGIGYKGRTGIFEVFVMSAELEQLILAKELSEYKIEELLVKQGMLTMLQDGLLKVVQGLTSLEEVYRVTE